MFADVGYYLLLSASSQAWPVHPPAAGCPVPQLWWQWARGGRVLLVWRGAGGHVVARLALEPAVLVALAACQTGRRDWQCCARRGELPVCPAVNQAARP